MSVKFFGHFLLERGKIIKEELLDALEFQKSINVKLGTIALDAGYLTANQVERIHQEQQRTDKLFGEIAIELRYLTPEQLEELLLIQKNERISFGDALVQKGYLSLHELEEELKIYKKQHQETSDDVYKVVAQTKNSKIPGTFLDTTIKFLRRLADINVGIIDSHIDAKRLTPFLWNIHQEFFGDVSGFYILSFMDQTFLKVASSLADEKLTEIDDFVKDGVKEFINILVGNSAAKFSHEGIKINLKPPQILTSTSLLRIEEKKYDVISIKLASPDYELQMSLAYTCNK